MSTVRERAAEIIRPTWAEIDTAAFARNVDAVARLLPDGSRLIAVLKANAYGHGATELAKRCTPERVAMIAVAILEEALELRRAGITQPLIVLGPLDERGASIALDHDLMLAVVGPESLAVACRIARERDVAIHLKLDSGMGRMGVTETELPDVVQMIRSAPRLRIDAIYTHYASAGEDEAFTATQTANFDKMLTMLREAGIDAPLHHLANSAATVSGIVRPGDYARCGVVLFGAGDHDARATGGRPSSRPEAGVTDPVMRWRTEISRLKTLPPGHAIGYGTTFHTKRTSRIATLLVGYADGYHRALSNRAEVIVRGQRAPVVGRVSMDLITIDVTDIADAAPGDEVVLLGDGITASELAQKAGTISYEVLCSVSARVPRVYR
jgi:alanine racemase